MNVKRGLRCPYMVRMSSDSASAVMFKGGWKGGKVERSHIDGAWKGEIQEIKYPMSMYCSI